MGSYTNNSSQSRLAGVGYQTVNNFADLPPAVANMDTIIVVRSTTGVWAINRKVAGLYISDGTNWTRLSTNAIFGTIGDKEVDLTNLNDNDFIVYDSTLGKFKVSTTGLGTTLTQEQLDSELATFKANNIPFSKTKDTLTNLSTTEQKLSFQGYGIYDIKITAANDDIGVFKISVGVNKGHAYSLKVFGQAGINTSIEGFNITLTVTGFSTKYRLRMNGGSATFYLEALTQTTGNTSLIAIKTLF